MSPEGQAKVNLILELKNRLKTGLTQAKQNLNQSVSAMKSKLSELKNKHVASFKAMRDEIPGFGKAMSVLGNPYVLITAGLLSLGVYFGKATAASMRFNAEFLNVRQLNLDKSKQELDNYRKQALIAAFEVGISGTQTAKALYDIQSATGLYGNSAISVFKDVAKYSIATGATLSDSVNATTKAMKAFGLTTKDMKAYLESNAKTVQVGIVTFDELAKVQTNFAGAAAGAGQDVNTANKIFAAFTSIAKNADIAANMTKTAFEGLTQDSTIKGLKSIGISMYDTRGNMRDLSQVLGEVSARFNDMTPKQIDELINKIGGPEGLRALFVKLKTNSKDFFDTLTAFDTTKFNLDEALANAMNDPTKLKEIVGNRWETLMATIGIKFMPIVAKVLNGINNTLEFTYKHLDNIIPVVKGVGAAIGVALLATKGWAAAQAAVNLAMNISPIGIIITAIAALVGAMVWAYNKFEAFRGVIWGIWDGLKTFAKGIKDGVINVIMGMVNVFKGLGKIIRSVFDLDWDGVKQGFNETTAGFKQAASGALDAVPITSAIKNGREIGQSFKTGYNEGIADFRAKKAEKENPFSASPSNANDGAVTATATQQPSAPVGAESVNAITGSAKQIRNISVNIDSFVKGMNISNQNVNQMDNKQIEAFFSELFLRVVRNLETSYQ